MHDIATIVSDPAAFDEILAKRGMAACAQSLVEKDNIRRKKIQAAEKALAERNQAARDVAKAKTAGDEDEFIRLRDLMSRAKAEISRLEMEAKRAEADLRANLLVIPNLPLADVPEGDDENDNVEIRSHGAIPAFAFAPKEHFLLGDALGQMHFECSAKIAGSRFMMLSGALARLHRALGQFMVDLHVNEHGLVEQWVPIMANEAALLGTGQLPKFEDDLFQTDNSLWLVPTAEVPLTNIVQGEILPESSLPRRYVSLTQCFRSEAGAAGKDTRGLMRQHQFEKVEMVSITRPEDSLDELDRMTGCAEAVLERLNLPYRTVILCTGDMGFAASKTHDIEVWLPGQNRYREISSCSVCGDFQARRMNARFRREGQKKPEFVHTLNGSGLAVGRCLIAIMENHQQEDGSILLPEPLQPYMGGACAISVSGELT